MRKLLFVASLLGFVGLLTTPAWAPGGKDWSKVQAATSSPQQAGNYCQTDPATKQQCTTLYNTCMQQAKNKRICPGDRYDCCHHLAIRRWN
jgi:hypothetical protein